MDNFTLQLKIKQRLNKLSSNDYDNIECWMMVEAFNKGMVDWGRRNLHGLNLVKEGDEQSKRRIGSLSNTKSFCWDGEWSKELKLPIHEMVSLSRSCLA